MNKHINKKQKKINAWIDNNTMCIANSDSCDLILNLETL